MPRAATKHWENTTLGNLNSGNGHPHWKKMNKEMVLRVNLLALTTCMFGVTISHKENNVQQNDGKRNFEATTVSKHKGREKQ